MSETIDGLKQHIKLITQQNATLVRQNKEMAGILSHHEQLPSELAQRAVRILKELELEQAPRLGETVKKWKEK